MRPYYRRGILPRRCKSSTSRRMGCYGRCWPEPSGVQSRLWCRCKCSLSCSTNRYLRGQISSQLRGSWVTLVVPLRLLGCSNETVKHKKASLANKLFYFLDTSQNLLSRVIGEKLGVIEFTWCSGLMDAVMFCTYLLVQSLSRPVSLPSYLPISVYVFMYLVAASKLQPAACPLTPRGQPVLCRRPARRHVPAVFQ